MLASVRFFKLGLFLVEIPSRRWNCLDINFMCFSVFRVGGGAGGTTTALSRLRLGFLGDAGQGLIRLPQDLIAFMCGLMGISAGCCSVSES